MSISFKSKDNNQYLDLSGFQLARTHLRCSIHHAKFFRGFSRALSDGCYYCARVSGSRVYSLQQTQPTVLVAFGKGINVKAWLHMGSMIPCALMLTASACALAQPSMDIGALSKFARDTGMPAKAILTGPTADYLHQQLKTQAQIFAEAVVLRKIDNKCQRVRVNFNIPDLVVTARNPANPQETRTGPFEAALELSLCS
jgi:hypothetical protein